MKKLKHLKKKPTERASFYIALSICMMAVAFAVWSAYTTLGDTTEPDDHTYFSSLSTENAAVAQEMTGVTEGDTEAPAEPPTQPSTEAPAEPERRLFISETLPASRETSQEDPSDPLQAVLKVNEDLVYPVKSQRVVKAYSENGVYNKTLRDHRAHTGCDFAAEAGESVYAMCGGTVTDISVSELYGAIIEMNCGEFSVYYCGLDTNFMVEKGEELNTGDTIGKVGRIPCESEDDSHVHIEIRVGNTLVDPLSVIGSDN